MRTGEWKDQAACLGLPEDIFFTELAEQGRPPRHVKAAQERAEARAKAVCAGCPVREECLEYALGERIEFGVWGGMTEDERAAVLVVRSGRPAPGVAA